MDIRTEIEVEVRLADIEQGWPRIADNCPIALALRRVFPEALDIEVDGDAAQVNLRSAAYVNFGLTYWLPKEAREFVTQFDFRFGEPLMPIRFKAVLREYDNE